MAGGKINGVNPEAVRILAAKQDMQAQVGAQFQALQARMGFDEHLHYQREAGENRRNIKLIAATLLASPGATAHSFVSAARDAIEIADEVDRQLDERVAKLKAEQEATEKAEQAKVQPLVVEG